MHCTVQTGLCRHTVGSMGRIVSSERGNPSGVGPVTMNPEFAAQLVLAGYALVALAAIVIQAARCQDGWVVWLLSVVGRLICSNLLHVRANRRCPFPQHGPALIIANHRSPTDPLVLWINHRLSGSEWNIRPIGFLMAREYYEARSIHWLSRAMQSIPVDRQGADMAPARAALRRLQEGRLVGIFPEGRINTGEGLLPANPGVAWLALRAEVPVFPVYIHGAPQRGTMTQSFVTPARVRVYYGDPIDLSAYQNRRKTQELLQEVVDYLMSHIADLAAEATGKPPERQYPRLQRPAV